MFKADQFNVSNEAVINQFAHFAQLSLANLEKFAEIGLDAARDSVEQATAHAAALAGAKDVHEVIAINSAALEPVMKRAYAYSRTVYETAAETNAEVKKVIEKQAADLNKSAVHQIFSPVVHMAGRHLRGMFGELFFKIGNELSISMDGRIHIVGPSVDIHEFDDLQNEILAACTHKGQELIDLLIVHTF